MSAFELSRDPRAGADALYRAYRQDVYRSLLRDLGSPADADDGTQTVFLSAFRSLDRGCRPHAARAWLLAIAKNVARRMWRERAGAGVELEPDSVAAAEPPDESRRELVAALETLPEGQRTTLVLHELYGLRYDEISQLTQQTVAGVETSVFRARRAVRTALRDNGALGHEAAARLLARYVAGKLTRQERVSLQAHVEKCAECTDAEAKLRSRRVRSHVLQWILAVPAAVQRMAAFVQSTPLRGAGAVAVCAAALASAAGDGPADRAPSTSPAVTGREQVRTPLRASTTADRRIAFERHAGAPSPARAKRRSERARARAADHGVASHAQPRAPRKGGRDGAVVVSAPDSPTPPDVPRARQPAPPREAPSAADRPTATATTSVHVALPGTSIDPALEVLGGMLDEAGATTDDLVGSVEHAADTVTDTVENAAPAVTDPAVELVHEPPSPGLHAVGPPGP
jgi:RNA polymerase sigma-70 factor (ECF subfamily)